MMNVIESAFDNETSQKPSINLFLELIFKQGRTVHHQDLLMGLIPAILREWDSKSVKIDKFGDFLKDAVIQSPQPGEKEKKTPNSFSWIIDNENPEDYPELDRYTSISGKLRTIKSTDSTNPVIMDSNFEWEVAR